MGSSDQRPGGRRCGRHLVLPVLVLVGVVNSALSQRFEAHLVERLPHFFIVEVADINNHGEMVGSAYRGSGGVVAVLWRADGSAVELPYLPDNPTDPRANAYGINDRGEIVGRSSVGAIPGVAVMWPNENQIVRLLRGSSVAVDINESGAIIGYGEIDLFRFQGFLLGPTGSSAMLPLLQMQYADGINDRGQVVGEGPGLVPMRWQDNQFIALPTLGRRASAYTISPSGVIGGTAEDESGAFVPVRWHNDEIRELPMPREIAGFVDSINESGVMAGAWQIEPGTSRVAIWRNNLMTEPNDLLIDAQRGVWVVGYGPGLWINDVGQIAGRGWDGVTSGVVRLDPVDIGLTLIGFEPSRPGRRNVIEVNHATPGGRVSILWGTARGEPAPLEQCPGAMIDITDPRLAATGVAGSDGRATISVFIPAHVEGTYILQAVDHRTCEVSPPAWALLKMEN